MPQDDKIKMIMNWINASVRTPKKQIEELPLRYKGKYYIGKYWDTNYFWFPFGCVGIDYDGNPIPEELRDVEWLEGSQRNEMEKKQLIDVFYEKWKKETKRNGGILVGPSIKECLSCFYDEFEK